MFAGFSERDAALTILGEAEGEPYQGKVAIGEVIRRRGSLKPFSGRLRCMKRPCKGFSDASRAWRDSEHTNESKGATHFENIETFGKPKWAYRMQPIKKIGRHTFFK